MKDTNNLYALIFAGIGIAVVSIYILFRFNFSKMLTSLILMSGTALITVGIFSLINGPFVSIITLGILVLTSFGYSILVTYFNKEKEILKERKKELSTDLMLRRDSYEYAINNYYNNVLITSLLSAFIVISMFFATGIEQYLLILILLGMILFVIATKVISLPLESFFTKVFNGVKTKIVNKHQARKDKKGKNKKNDNEGPEEAIFVGIND